MKAKMNPRTYLMLLIGILVFSCSKSEFPTEAEIDPNIGLGETKIYLNGKVQINFEPDFLFIPLHDYIRFGFKDEVEDWLWNILGFSGLKLQTGRFELVDKGPIHNGAITSFVQVYQEDLEGYSYKLINQQDGYFEIESLDTIKQEVKGSFKAIFERTSKNGHSDLRLPKILLFQGVFYEKYEHL